GFSENNDTNGIYFLKEPEGYFSNRWLSTILIHPQETAGVSAEHIRLALEPENIECRPLWKPMHRQPLYQDAPSYGAGLSDTLFQHGRCLPSGSSLTTRELSKIVSCIKASLK